MDLLERFSLYACLQCGKCTGGCPVSLRSPLNIRRIMREALLFGTQELLLRPELWDCTTCKACTLRCPRNLEPSELLIALRGQLVESGRVPKPVMDALEATYVHGNPWGRARQKRADWAEGLGLKRLPEGGPAQGLYFVGCAPSYDPRLQPIAVNLSRMMRAAGLDFGILGTKESCCGNEIRRMGEEGLFEELRDQNGENFRSCQVSWIVTTSPHCFNTFKNEYELEGIEVLHYTQLIERLIREGRLLPRRPLRLKVVYHDPCFLGKQNGVFDPPRAILGAIPGLQLLEFPRSREMILCCEGGGGRMWVEGSGTGTRNSEIRVQEALQLGAEVIATACPFCLLTLEDALKTTGLEGRLRIMDITEILSQSLSLEVQDGRDRVP
ncbi:MAG: hypothetical protein DRG31_06750 [Deltaproteobacteria bacterium]|nr:MAG: hypothetical protein DRG31_06750 [Deltaproteobacteria bacterium]